MKNYKDELDQLHAPESLILKTLDRVHAAEAEMESNKDEHETVDKAANATVNEAVGETVSEAAKEAVGETVSEAAKETVSETVRESAKEVVNETVNGTSYKETQNNVVNAEDKFSGTAGQNIKKSRRLNVKVIYPFIIGAVSLAACFLLFRIVNSGMKGTDLGSTNMDMSVNYENTEAEKEAEADIAEEAAEETDGAMTAATTTADIAEDTEAYAPEAEDRDENQYKGADGEKTETVVTGNAEYNKQDIIGRYSSEMDSSFKTFPDDLSGMKKADFNMDFSTGILDTDGIMVLDAEFEETAFKKELIRLKNVSCNVSYEDESVEQKVIYDETMYNYPAYIAIDGFDYVYEYALIDMDNQRIIYVIVSYPKDIDVSAYTDFMKKDAAAYDIDNSTVIDQFSIYAHKFKGCDGYIVNSED